MPSYISKPFKTTQAPDGAKKQCKVVIKGLTCEHCEQHFATQQDLKRHHQRKQKACILIQKLKAAHQEDIDKLRQELAAKQQQLDLLNANAHDLQEELKAGKAAHASMSNPLEELLYRKISDMHQAVSGVKAAVCSGSDLQNLAENSVCSTYEEVGTATRLGASIDITSHKSGIATTTELTSIAADMVSCNVVDRTAIVTLDTHVESSSEAAHQDLMGYAHASHSTTLAAMNTTLRVADETVIGRLRDEESELENCFGQASMVRMPMADSQSKVSSRQSFARGTPNEYGKESCDYWHDIEMPQYTSWLEMSQPTYGISRISSRRACCWTLLIIARLLSFSLPYLGAVRRLSCNVSALLHTVRSIVVGQPCLLSVGPAAV